MPQPIDFQTELTRVTTVERVQMVADRMAMLAQQRLAQEIDAQEAVSESQVAETHAKSGEVEPELKRKNPYISRKHKKSEDEPVEEEAAEKNLPQPPPEPHALDVTI